MRKQIPNLFTLLNLFSGCIATVFLLQGAQYKVVALMSLFSLFFDYLDGFFARILKLKSDLGKQLDSLADLVSFGVVPSVIAFIFLKESLQVSDFLPKNFEFIAFFIALASSWRLAKFNLESGSHSHFKGLPTPANSFFFVSLSLAKIYNCNMGFIFESSFILSILIILSSYLLISPIEMISFKFNSLKWKENKARYLFLVLCLILIIIAPGFCTLIYLPILYIISSIIFKQLFKFL